MPDARRRPRAPSTAHIAQLESFGIVNYNVDSHPHSFDNLQTVPKVNIGAPIAHLSAIKMNAASLAVAFALNLPGLD